MTVHESKLDTIGAPDRAKGHEIALYRKDTSGNDLQKITTTWEIYTTSVPTYFPYAQWVQEYIQEGSGLPANPQKKTFYAYEISRQNDAQYGNLTQILEYQGGTPYRQTLHYFYPNTTTWIVDIPGLTWLKVVTDGVSYSQTKTKFIYDDPGNSYDTSPERGDLVRKEQTVSVSPGDSWITTQAITYTDYAHHYLPYIVADGNGNQTTTTYDAIWMMYPLTVTNALSQATAYEYDYVLGKVKKVTGPNGAATATSYEFDEFGRLTKIIRPDDTAAYPTTKYEYCDACTPLCITTTQRLTSGAGGVDISTLRFYNGLGQLIQENTGTTDDSQMTIANTVYNAQGLVEKAYLPYTATYTTTYLTPDTNQPKITYTYDALGRTKVITNTDGTAVLTDYNGLAKTVVDENSHQKVYENDALGRLVTVKEYTGTYPSATLYATTTYTYNTLDLLTAVIDTTSSTTTMTYDALGRKTAMTDPDMGVWSYTYDNAANLTRQTDAKGQRICFYYDALNRLTGKHYRSNDSCPAPADPQLAVGYSYDTTAGGNLGIGYRTAMSDTVSGNTVWKYDTRGRVIEEVKVITGTGGPFTTTWAYNAADMVVTQVYPGSPAETATTTYDKWGRASALTGSSDYVTNATYDALGRPDVIQFGNGQRTDYDYYAMTQDGGRLHGIKTGTTSPYTGTQYLHYDYDSVGNVVSISDLNNLSQVQSFTYDSLDRLTAASTNAYGADQYSDTYSYSTIGNLNEKSGLVYYYSSTRPQAVRSVIGDLDSVEPYSVTIRARGVPDTENPTMTLRVNGIPTAAWSVAGDGMGAMMASGEPTGDSAVQGGRQAIQIPDPIPQDVGSDFTPIRRAPSLDPDSQESEMMSPDDLGWGDIGFPPPPVDASELLTSGTAVYAPEYQPLGGVSIQQTTAGLGIFSPMAGNRAPGWSWNFRSQFSDTLGYGNLKEVYVRFTQPSGDPNQNAIYLRYDQSSNLVYMRDSDDTAWIGGYQPGSAVELSKRNGSLDVSKTSVVTYGTYYLDVYWEVYFKSTGESEHYDIYGKATDDGGGDTGWILWTQGSQTAYHRMNMWAATGGVTPSSSTQPISTTTLITTTYTDPEGWDDLVHVFLDIASDAAGTSQAIYAVYHVLTNTIQIRDDAGTGWLGPITPGDQQDIENSWGIVHGSGCSVSPDRDTITVTWSIEFKSALADTTRNIYLYAQDKLSWVSGWQYAGQITITSSGALASLPVSMMSGSAPEVISVTPSGYSSMPDYVRTFQAVYEDDDGWDDLTDVYLMWNLSGASCPQQFRYEVGANKFYIRNDTDSGWIGGFEPGTNIRLSNWSMSLDVQQTAVVTSADRITVTWGLYPKQPVTSTNWKVYLKADDSTSQTTGWVEKGAWRVNMFPNVGGLSPISETLHPYAPQDFTITYVDEDGADTIDRAFISALPTGEGWESRDLWAYYYQKYNRIYLNTGPNQWMSGIVGSDDVLENSTVILYLGDCSVDAGEKALTVTWNIAFKQGTEGAKDIYGYVYDQHNFQDGWSVVGHTTVAEDYDYYSTVAWLTGDDVLEVAYTNDSTSDGLEVDFVEVFTTSQTIARVPSDGGAMVYDLGSGDAAWDGFDVIAGQEALTTNGALRFVVGPGARNAGYDANGNMTSRLEEGEALLLAYDQENRLVEVKGGDDTVIAAFVYDGDGNRVKGVVGDVTTFYVSNYFEAGTAWAKYYYFNGLRVAMRDTDGVRWIHGDHLGSSMRTTDSGGSPSDPRRYYPYGAKRNATGTELVTPYRFTGQREEGTIGLYFYNARWYDAALGRFAQADTIVPEPGNPQALNRYSYTLSNPVKYTDPSGHWTDEGAGWEWDPVRRPPEPSSPLDSIKDLYKDVFAGGRIVRMNRDTIVRVERERHIPQGRLGAVIRHEASAWHKIPDSAAALLGREVTIGIAEVSVRTAERLEDLGYMPASKTDRDRIWRLIDPTLNIEYAGAYLQHLYQYVNERAPQGTSERAKWDLAVVTYNIGEGNFDKTIQEYGFGGLGPLGQHYYSQVIPHIPEAVKWLYYSH